MNGLVKKLRELLPVDRKKEIQRLVKEKNYWRNNYFKLKNGTSNR